MLNQARALTREYAMLPPGETVLCAVSGGADSMCLLHWLLAQGVPVHAAHYHHGLRGAEADRDAAFVADWCAGRTVPFTLGRGDVAAQAKRLGQGVEETARLLRYDFLEQARLSAGAALIATAHNADDNAETLLMHLIRGSGLQGLTGIPPRRGRLVRPLLTTGRGEIEAYVAQQKIPFVEDSTNADTAYTRNRLRHEVMPLLRQLNPRLTQGLTHTAGALRADNDYLNAQAGGLLRQARRTGEDWLVPAALLAAQPLPIALRLARQLLAKVGDGSGKCTAAHLRAVVDLARGPDPSAALDLPGGLTVCRVYRDLLFTAGPPLPPLGEVPVDPEREGVYRLGLWTVICRPALCPEQPKRPDHCFLALAGLEGPLVLRPRRTGDEIRLPLRDRKRVKKLFIDEKVPRLLRDRVPILADGRGPLVVAGLGPSMPHLAQPGAPALEVLLSTTEEKSEVFSHAGQ